jgi:hypothetical protein
MKREGKILSAVLLILCILSIQTNAQLVVIDFEELSSTGKSWGDLGSQEYISNGFRFTTDADYFDYATFYGPSSIALSVGENTGLVQVETIDSTLFEVQAISFIANTTSSFMLTGIKSDLSSVQYNIITNDNWQIEDYTLDNFTDLVTLSWSCDPELYFDNINVIPEPCTLLLFALGGLILRNGENLCGILTVKMV